MQDFILNYGPTIFNILVQCGVLKCVYSWIQSNKEKAEKEAEQKEAEAKATRDAIRCMLRSHIIKICCKSEERGYIAIYEVENLTDMYNSYLVLGGNGAIKELYKEAMSLPHVMQNRGVDD